MDNEDFHRVWYSYHYLPGYPLMAPYIIYGGIGIKDVLIMCLGGET